MKTEANFTTENCPRCKYVLGEKKRAKDGSQERFTCLRCGYHYIIDSGAKTVHFGLGSWCMVSESGIGASAIYVDKSFFDNIDKLHKAFDGGKLFYAKLNDADNKYYLVEPKTGRELEFSDDMEICFDGLRKVKK